MKGGKKKEHLMPVRMSKDDREMARRKATKLGLTVSAYVRMLIHRDKER